MERNVRAGQNAPHHRYTGLIKCGDCGSSFVCRKRVWKDNVRYEYICNGYHRYGKENCTAHRIDESTLDKLIYDELIAIKEEAETNYRTIENDVKSWLAKKNTSEKRIKNLTDKLAQRKSDQEQILLERIRDREHADIYTGMLEKCEPEIKSLTAEIEAIRDYDTTIRKRKAEMKGSIDILDGIIKDGAVSDNNLRLLVDNTATHLKSLFPRLKIGGPALAWREDWADRFLTRVEERHLPLDFFSWHIYCTTPERMMEKNARVQALLERHGFGGVENILNEWNYIRGWDRDFVYSVKQISGLKGASFTLACMCEAQKSSIDMLMYYDARPSAFNGLFSPFTLEPLKGYYPFLWYGMLYGRQEVRAERQPEHLYSLCGVDGDGKTLTLLTHYDENDEAGEQTVTLDFGRRSTYEVYLLDQTHDGTLLGKVDDLTFTLPVHTSLLIKEL